MVVDVLAVILGILFSIRKLETRKREAEHFPSVPAASFERYKALALRAANLGAGVCFAKLLLDYGFRYLAGKMDIPWPTVRVVGASIFFGWLGLLILAIVLGRQARKIAAEAGIDLRIPIPEPRNERS